MNKITRIIAFLPCFFVESNRFFTFIAPTPSKLIELSFSRFRNEKINMFNLAELVEETGHPGQDAVPVLLVLAVALLIQFNHYLISIFFSNSIVKKREILKWKSNANSHSG